MTAYGALRYQHISICEAIITVVSSPDGGMLDQQRRVRREHRQLGIVRAQRAPAL